MTINPSAKQELATVTTYMIPKRWVWSAIALLLGWLVYEAYDRVSHMNWPPADRSNDAYLKTLECDKGSNYLVTKQMLEGDANSKIFTLVGIDRTAFIKDPKCVIGFYLGFEGSGVRNEFNVYDMTTKRKTAHISITHEAFAHQ